MGSLEVSHLTKKFSGTAVVDDVSFRIEEGEFFVLLGTSGSGKSTMLRLICGLETPDGGQVLLDGRDVTGLTPRDRHLGMVFQDYGLYPNMNVYQNVAYGLEARGMAKNDIDQRVNTAATMLGLGEMLNRSIVDLSGGEQQRVAVARAMAKDAAAYLFDEPLSNLDPKLRYQARRDIMTLHRQKQKPTLYVTHDQTEAFAMADRIAIMANGKLQQIADGETILNRPANLHVARFTGSPSMNLVEGIVSHQGSAYEIALDGFSLTLPERWNAPLEKYGKNRVILGFRPESLLLAGSAAADEGLPTFKGHIENLEMLVGEMVASVKLGERTFVAAVFPDDGEFELDAGYVVPLALDVERISLFDPQTERAIS